MKQRTYKKYRVDLTNKKFGRLLVKKYSHNIKNKGSYWECVCDCGITKCICASGLRNKQTQSCGCLRVDRLRKKLIKPNEEAAFNRVKKGYKTGAKTRQYKFELNDSTLRRLFEGNCFYCKASPSLIQKTSRKDSHYIYNGIDRLDNDVGYIEKNCVSCCKFCNYAKHTHTFSVFMKWIDSLVLTRFNHLSFQSSIGFDKIAIQQKKNICKSRLEVDISSEIIRGVRRPIPLIASNMSSVINSDFYNELYDLGAFGILHRALDTPLYLKEVSKVAKNCEWVAASIGIGKDQYDLAKQLVGAGCNIIVIDVAHGYSDLVIELGRKIKKELGVKIVLGNTTNIGMLHETADFVDALKIGIAQGYACETKNTAGCTEKQFSAVLKFKEEAKLLGIPIISDGGIREPADFTKAILAGANSVMAGSIFARCPSSAAETILNESDQIKKVYFGMASRQAQELWKNGLKKGTCPEGKTVYLDIGESAENLLTRYSGALKSGITYAGGNSIETAQNSVEFIELI